jgi:predicted dehydrogenase
MIRVGIAGIGFMGMVHYLTYQKIRGVKVAAICEQDPQRLSGDWRGIQGNFGPKGKRMDLADVTTYSALDDLIADDSLDLIDVTLPPSSHADIAVQALNAGKHVFCEKPMALTLPECQRMAKAAKRAGKLLMIGHVLPFVPEFAWALKIVKSGTHGKLLGGSFKRVISDPTWLRNFWDAKQVGGPMLDLHVHDAHFINLLFGKPKAVITHGSMRNGLAERWDSQFVYGSRGPTVHAVSGVIPRQSRPFDHGFEIYLEGATLAFEFAVHGSKGVQVCEPTLFGSGKPKRAKLPPSDPMDSFHAEIKEVLRCVRQSVESPILNIKLAQNAILVCQKQTESLKTGRAVKLK